MDYSTAVCFGLMVLSVFLSGLYLLTLDGPDDETLG